MTYMSGFQMGIFVDHSTAYLSGMMFLRCNRTHQGTLASYPHPTPMRFDVRPTSPAWLLENDHGGCAGCDAGLPPTAGQAENLTTRRLSEKLSVSCKMLVILLNGASIYSIRHPRAP